MKEGWEYKKLGEVATQINGFAFRSSLFKGVGKPIVRISNIQNDIITSDFVYFDKNDYKENLDKYEVHYGDVLIAMSGATTGKVGINKNKETLYLNQRVGKIVPNKNLHSIYLFYYLKHNSKMSLSVAQGLAQPNLSSQQINNFTIPVPHLSEQQRIVEELDLLSSIIDKKKEQLKELDNLAQSIFYDMFGDPVSNEKGWDVKKLEDISSLITDGSHYSPKNDDNGKIPMLSVKDMEQTKFNYNDCKWIDESEYSKLLANGCKPLKNDVLIAKDGSFFKYVFVLSDEREQAILSSIAILRPITDIVNPHFVAKFLSTKEVFYKVEKEYLTGTAIKRVILKGIRKMPISVPPLSLQQQFASKIEAIEHQKELIKQSIKEVETLFNSRMDYYFN